MKISDILLIDDDVDFLYLLKRIFELEGFSVAVASDGVNALKILENCKFRIIITDLEMPGINGLELAARIREKLSGATVVMITGNTISDVAEEALTVGISKIFSKPVNVPKLVAAIRPYITQEMSFV